jgi:hypothetical protein
VHTAASVSFHGCHARLANPDPDERPAWVESRPSGWSVNREISMSQEVPGADSWPTPGIMKFDL